jgi:hypothetical protein
MATNLQHAVTNLGQVIPDINPVPAVTFVRSLWDRASRSIQSAMCGIHGHDPLLQVEGNRMFLRCTTCGHETPGWVTSERGPRARFGGDRARHRLN